MRKLFKILGKIAGILAGLYALLFAVFYFDLDGQAVVLRLSRSSAGITIKWNA